MRIYSSIAVDLTFQNFGSSWLLILRGKTEDIESVFLGLWNLGATDGDLEYRNHTQTVARVWSTEARMFRFFLNQFDIPRSQHKHKRRKQDASYLAGLWVAKNKIKTLRETSHEFFLNHKNVFMADIYAMGKVTAENPDLDMKDSILMNAFTEKDVDSKPIAE